MSPKALAAAKKLPHPLDQHHVQKSLDTIAHLLPKHEKLANEVARNPSDEDKKNELQAATEQIKDELDNLRQALRGSPTPAALKDAAENAKSQAKKVSLSNHLKSILNLNTGQGRFSKTHSSQC